MKVTTLLGFVIVDDDHRAAAREEVYLLADWGKHPATFNEFELQLDTMCCTPSYKNEYPEDLVYCLHALADEPQKMMLVPWSQEDKDIIARMVNEYVEERSEEIAWEEVREARICY